MRRGLSLGCAVLLLALATLKALDLNVLDPWSATAASIEAAIGISFLVNRTPRLSAAAMTLLGAAFCVWTARDGIVRVGDAPCRCLGAYTPHYMVRMGLAALVLGLGGCMLRASDDRPGGERARDTRIRQAPFVVAVSERNPEGVAKR